ncbi:uncharacterized protein ALTATR162_LOCUS46 [Alternaria atra]|uniref:HTH CENPB-type domain-containing protein n=1 Tax=Alternaria atra TaxID=119953 RepID=A0A8J2HQ77_9PLEO|nr:uncharacterized protein ALTATR162_LOCUS46 [Alternaria atra]CAG5137170.1 unnamed protein product [Alternaria atra]
MARYTEEDVQNALADLESGVALATAATRHGVPRNTLRGRFNGAQPHQRAHDGEQRLTNVQEEHLEKWILQQEALGYAPTHAQVRAIAIAVLKRQGGHKNLGKKWTSHFVKRHPAIKSKLGRRTSWERINEATPENIRHLFNLYETVSWIPPQRRYNADEGGIMEGQGINGLVIGSSQESPNSVPVKTINARTWTSVVECISAVGVALDPLVIFRAKSIQEQLFKQSFLAQNPGCLKTAYRRFVSEYTAWTDKTKLGKAKFLSFYAEARKIGLREQCIQSGWKATGLYPKNVRKPLGSRWVVVRERPSTPPPSTTDIRTPKRGSDVVKLFSGKSFSPNTRRCVWLTATAFDRTSIMVTMQDREIASLREQVEQANPPKRRKVRRNPNDLFASLAEVLSQTNQEPSQRVRKVRSAKQKVIIVEEERALRREQSNH